MAKAIETAHAYCAGFIDGEGCISINKRMNYRVEVIVVQKLKKPCEFFLGHYGGGISVVKRKKGFNPGEYYRWTVADQRAAKMLKKLFPYLILKKEQAKIGIELAARRNRWLGGYRRYHSMTAKELKEREKLYQRMKVLKRAGVETKPQTRSDSPVLGDGKVKE